MHLLELVLILGTLASAAAVGFVGAIGLVVWLAGGKDGRKPGRLA